MAHRKYTAEHETWLATNPLCACGCGKPFNRGYDNFASSMRQRGHPPLHCRGHNPLSGTGAAKCKANYAAWAATNPVCRGCGKPLKPEYKKYVWSILHYGEPPKSHKGCRVIRNHNKNRIELNGCTLIRTEHGRCEKSYRCRHYDSCLAAADKRHWSGWKIQ